MGYQAPLSSSFLPSNDSRHMRPSWFLRHVRYAFHPRRVSAFSFLSQNFSLRDYNNHVISLQVKQPKCSCDIALHRSTLLHKQSHCTGTGTRVSQAKTFWEIPRAVSLAEKNSRPKPPGTGSRSLLGVCVWDRVLHRSGRSCWSCRTSERLRQVMAYPKVRVQWSPSPFLAPQRELPLLAQLRPTHQSIRSTQELTA